MEYPKKKCDNWLFKDMNHKSKRNPKKKKLTATVSFLQFYVLPKLNKTSHLNNVTWNLRAFDIDVEKMKLIMQMLLFIKQN